MSERCDVPANSIVTFPEGVPGFESSRRFTILKPRHYAPILILQDVEQAHLSLPVIPAQFVDRGYRLRMDLPDREMLEFSEEPVLGENLLCLFVLVLPGAQSRATCNLFAPIVINPDSMRGKQVLQLGSDYPILFPLGGD